MQDKAPEDIQGEVITLTSNFINKIPAKQAEIRKRLHSALELKDKTFIAISGLEIEGNDFKIEGFLTDKEHNPLGFHKISVIDKDVIEDDYIGSVITGENGKFVLSFDGETFQDFGFFEKNKLPDFRFKIFKWKGNKFKLLKEFMPEIESVTPFGKDKKLIEFGTIIVQKTFQFNETDLQNGIIWNFY